MSRHPSSIIPLTPAAFHIMLVLAKRPAHGYRIMQEVERISDGKMKLGPGTLYRSIQRLFVEELIEELDDHLETEGDGERRRTYQLTDWGKRVAKAEASRLNALVEEARQCRLIESAGRRELRSIPPERSS